MSFANFSGKISFGLVFQALLRCESVSGSCFQIEAGWFSGGSTVTEDQV